MPIKKSKIYHICEFGERVAMMVIDAFRSVIECINKLYEVTTTRVRKPIEALLYQVFLKIV